MSWRFVSFVTWLLWTHSELWLHLFPVKISCCLGLWSWVWWPGATRNISTDELTGARWKYLFKILFLNLKVLKFNLIHLFRVYQNVSGDETWVWHRKSFPSRVPLSQPENALSPSDIHDIRPWQSMISWDQVEDYSHLKDSTLLALLRPDSISPANSQPSCLVQGWFWRWRMCLMAISMISVFSILPRPFFRYEEGIRRLRSARQLFILSLRRFSIILWDIGS